jgi:O-methyltransferase
MMTGDPALRSLYLSLLKKALLNDLYVENDAVLLAMLKASVQGMPIRLEDLVRIRRASAFGEIEAAKAEGAVITFSRPLPGGGWQPVDLLDLNNLWHTMIGRKRLEHLETCLERVVADAVPGDVIETGVWRGGATIFMRGFLAAHGITDRVVWVADSFEGLPPPSLPQDAAIDFSEIRKDLAISLDRVKALFERYGLLDDCVRFLPGWFKDTLPGAPIARLALLRLDGDLYESTMDALTALYHKLSPGGYVIIDDYFSCPPCAEAVVDYRRRHAVMEEMVPIDGQCVFWRKT